MLNLNRREYIQSQLARNHRVSVSELSEALEVSDETIRRDLNEFEAEGLLRRVYGGAIPATPIRDKPVDQRDKMQNKEKEVIAKLAREQIADNTMIFLDTGTTTLELARRLTNFSNLNVYTNSLKVALAAAEHQGVNVNLTPGRVRTQDQDVVGSDTIMFIQRFYFDIAFMGIVGIDADRGFMDYEENAARIRETLIKSARLPVFLADSGKFGKTANVQTATFEASVQVITDQEPSKEFLDIFADSKVSILYA